ncbi:hypothetical protein PQR02_37055 [Paraburkholderia sediminicola]|uniref:Uncharacterized protein n=1 Tax=Paraburkholderia rhynchosiae TaxID=487049 RepID=A0ACC7NPV9_9BURK
MPFVLSLFLADFSWKKRLAALASRTERLAALDLLNVQVATVARYPACCANNNGAVSRGDGTRKAAAEDDERYENLSGRPAFILRSDTKRGIAP